MEKVLERGSDKVQKICDALRRETLEPAKEEAERTLRDAKAKAEQILHEAHQHAAKLLEDAKASMDKERQLFGSSLKQAAQQSLTELRHAIEEELFSKELHRFVTSNISSAQVIAKLIDAIVLAVEKEGLSKDFSAVIPEAVSVREVNDLIGQNILKRLKEGSVVVAPFGGGFQLKLHDRNMTLDFTEETLVELLGRYLRKDFRHMLFS